MQIPVHPTVIAQESVDIYKGGDQRFSIAKVGFTCQMSRPNKILHKIEALVPSRAGLLLLNVTKDLF